jgi:hypothetical protein
VLRTLDRDRPLRLVFGFCRIADLPVPARRQGRTRDEPEHGGDALVGYALGLRETPRGSWSDVMLLIGDQVYTDPHPHRSRGQGRCRAPYRDPASCQYSSRWSRRVEPEYRWR